MNTGRILNYLAPLPIGEFWTSALSCTREYAVFVVLKGLCSLNVERKCRLAWYCKGHLRFIHADHRLYKHSSCLYFGTLFTAQDFAINNANVDFPLRVGTSTVVRLRLILYTICFVTSVVTSYVSCREEITGKIIARMATFTTNEGA